MHYKVLFRVEKYDLMDKLKHKVRNFRRYLVEMGDTAEIEVVFAGGVVKHFCDLSVLQSHELEGGELLGANPDIRLALCHNALSGSEMDDIDEGNIRTVRAGVGEVIRLKSLGYIEYTIE